jgi:hypothetical protein
MPAHQAEKRSSSTTPPETPTAEQRKRIGVVAVPTGRSANGPEARAWEGLAEIERQTGQPYHTALRFRAEQPDLRSAQMAERLSVCLGKPLTAVGARQTLHRARDQFADLLLDEVARSLPSRPASARRGTAELNLLEYCRPASRAGHDAKFPRLPRLGQDRCNQNRFTAMGSHFQNERARPNPRRH